MGKKVIKENFRVVVEPKDMGDFGYVRVSRGLLCPSTAEGRHRWERDVEDRCNDIVQEIKRHVNEVDSAYVEYDATPVCEHCGSVWSEESDVYNGGCCSKDEEMNGESSREDC